MEPEVSLPQSRVPATCPYPEPARSSPYPHILLLQELQSSATLNIGLHLSHRKKCNIRSGWQHPGIFFLWLLCRYLPTHLAYANKPKALSTTEVEEQWHTFTRREGVEKQGVLVGNCEVWGRVRAGVKGGCLFIRHLSVACLEPCRGRTWSWDGHVVFCQWYAKYIDKFVGFQANEFNWYSFEDQVLRGVAESLKRSNMIIFSTIFNAHFNINMYVTLLSSTCFGPWHAHPQEEQLYKHSIWYPRYGIKWAILY